MKKPFKFMFVETRKHAPNFREAVCCANCQHYEMDFDGDGSCKRHTTGDLYKFNDNFAQWHNVCDDHNKAEDKK